MKFERKKKEKNEIKEQFLKLKIKQIISFYLQL